MDVDGDIVDEVEEESLPDGTSVGIMHLDDDQRERLKSRENDEWKPSSAQRKKRSHPRLVVDDKHFERDGGENFDAMGLEGPPTPKELIDAAAKAASEGTGLNLALHDSPRSPRSPREQLSPAAFPGAPALSALDRSPRPNEEPKPKTRSDERKQTKSPTKRNDSSRPGERKRTDKSITSPEMALLNPRLTEELQEFRDQLGIGPVREFPDGSSSDARTSSRTGSLSKKQPSRSALPSAGAYEFSATPMTPRRRDAKDSQGSSAPRNGGSKSVTPSNTRSKTRTGRILSQPRPHTHASRHRSGDESTSKSSVKRRLSVDGSSVRRTRSLQKEAEKRENV